MCGPSPAGPCSIFAANKQPICPQTTAKELFDMEDDAGEKAAALVAYKRALKEFRDYSLVVPESAPVEAPAAGGDEDQERRIV